MATFVYYSVIIMAKIAFLGKLSYQPGWGVLQPIEPHALNPPMICTWSAYKYGINLN